MSRGLFAIREFSETDWPQVWSFLKPVFHSGETYAVATEISENSARELWVHQALKVWVVADADDKAIATYYLKPNFQGPGSHVCNCGYVVAEQARGNGLAKRMCEHSQVTALELGFRAMQFNCVVSTNVVAIRLWQSLGFEIAGTLPRAFRHPSQGFVTLT